MTIRTDVAIVGGGFAGAMLATHLLAGGPTGPRIALVERRADRLGAGLAYSTNSDTHVINARPNLMSAYPDDPDHFCRWLAVRRDPTQQVSDGGFVPRHVYRDYLADVFLVARNRPGAARRIRVVEAEVVDAVTDGLGVRLVFRSGEELAADHAVLALGHRQPRPLGLESTTMVVVEDPWSEEARQALRVDGPVVLVGSGLTAVDLALERAAEQPGAVTHLVSRHGSLPRSHPSEAGAGHGTSTPWPSQPSLRDLFAELRRRSDAGDWRSVVDSVRPCTNELWRGFAPADRDRYLRLLRRRGEVRRHRTAPFIGDQLRALVEAGAVSVHRGVVRSVAGAGVCIDTPAGSSVLDALAVVNCTGPELDLTKSGEPLLVSLFARRVVRAGPHGMGLDTTADGRLVDGDGRPSSRLWTLGPPRTGGLIESTAVLEVAAQAQALAAALGARTHHGGTDPVGRRASLQAAKT